MEIKEGYTRVSSILGQWNHLAHINKAVLANKCRIGTNVHAKIAAEMEGIFLEAEPDEEEYYESWSKWWKEEGGEPGKSLAEERFYCDDLKVTGCVDAIIETPKGHIIIDYKTSASVNKRMWTLQAGFYHYLAKKKHPHLLSEVWFLHLKKDGKVAKVYPLEITHHVWSVCSAALQTYRYFKG